MPQTPERRISPRIRVEPEINLTLLGLDWGEIKLSNISDSGVGLLSNHNMKIGSKIAIAISPDQILAVPVIVRYCRIISYEPTFMDYIYFVGAAYDLGVGSESEKMSNGMVFRQILLGQLGPKYSKGELLKEG